MSISGFRLALAALALSACVSATANDDVANRPATDPNVTAWDYGGIVKSYVFAPPGQIHVRMAAPDTGPALQRPHVLLLHPTAVSGDYYRDLMLDLADDRTVIALDTPGYGQSTPPDEPQSISALAASLSAALDSLGYGKEGKGAVDVLGFHTGTYLAAEMAIQRPDLIRRLVLPGIPYYQGSERTDRFRKYAKPRDIQEDGSHILDTWNFWVNSRGEEVSLERGAEHFYDQMQAGPRAWWAYHGVFSYDADTRLPLVTQPVFIPNDGGGLSANSRAAAKLFPNAQIVELEGAERGLFDAHYAKVASLMRDFLDAE